MRAVGTQQGYQLLRNQLLARRVARCHPSLFSGGIVARKRKKIDHIAPAFYAFLTSSLFPDGGNQQRGQQRCLDKSCHELAEPLCSEVFIRGLTLRKEILVGARSPRLPRLYKLPVRRGNLTCTPATVRKGYANINHTGTNLPLEHPEH